MRTYNLHFYDIKMLVTGLFYIDLNILKTIKIYISTFLGRSDLFKRNLNVSIQTIILVVLFFFYEKNSCVEV